MASAGCASRAPLRTAVFTHPSPSCTERTQASHRPCKQPNQTRSSSLHEKIKAHKSTMGGTAAARQDLVSADLLAGSPPLPQAVCCWMKEHRCCQESFHIDFPHNGRMTSAQRTIPTARTSNRQLP